MTSTDTAGHPEVTEISDLTEGLLPPSRMTDVRRHVEDCALCADVYASLEEIRDMLGTLPGPSRMPADVAERIDAALAAEALLNATEPDADTAGARELVGASRPVADESGGSRVSRETSTAADRPAGRPRAATGPGRTKRTRPSRRGAVLLGAMFTAAALGLGGVLLQSMGDDTPGTTPEQGRADSANTFTEGKLESQVADLLASSEGQDDGSRNNKSPWGHQSDPDEPSTLKEPKAAVPECIQQGIGRNEAALAFEKGTYEDTNVYLVVLPDASNATRVTAYVVDSACVAKSPDSAGKVLLRQSYERR
ncbi:membrane protein [Streptomyces yerevanensis]|uniref:membrane protein n=1 Tax=Streptomyces yerevanensis TaxID=66378 RepID=UPI0005278AD1|nr:membrane protein [Streptomyces yerevanensis]